MYTIDTSDIFWDMNFDIDKSEKKKEKEKTSMPQFISIYHKFWDIKFIFSQIEPFYIMKKKKLKTLSKTHEVKTNN